MTNDGIELASPEVVTGCRIRFWVEMEAEKPETDEMREGVLRVN